VGVTFDETAHLTAGLSYWTTGEYRLQPENGNLPQRWAALPLLVADTALPAWEGKAWATADVWWFGRQLFFHTTNDTAALLLGGRSMILLFGISLVALVYYWSRLLYGPTGGLLSLGLAVFCPHLLAHSALITSDIAASLGFMLALVTWWRLCHRITLGRLIAAGLAMGFLALSKYSAALFAPIALLILVVRYIRPAPLPWQIGSNRGRIKASRRLWALLTVGIGAATVAVIIIWAAYGFRYSASNSTNHDFAEPWSVVLIEQTLISTSSIADMQETPETIVMQAGLVQNFVSWAREHKLLPEAYLYGLTFTDYHARGRPGYFAGEYRVTGWWQFFPVAFALKTTLPALLLLVLTFILFTRVHPAPRARLIYRLSPLLIFVGAYWLFAITSNLNIGHRHLLPIYSALYVIAGIVGSRRITKNSRIWMMTGCCLLAWHAVESWRVRPHYLTYFNNIAGGPGEGHHYFVDSSLDWGQGLPDLKNWLVANQQNEPVFLSYFGSDEPRRFTINATRIGDRYFNHNARVLLPHLTEGIYCISATMLRRVYTHVSGPWSAKHEKTYRDLLWKTSHAARGIMSNESRENLLLLEQLRFGRLCRYLEQRSPDAIVANSILVYRLSPADITRALHDPTTN